MKCKDCKNCAPIANTEECRQALCKYPMSYVPICIDNECIFAPKEYTCKNCSHFYYDTACMTCDENDSIYKNGNMCCGFEDKNEADLYDILADWKLRGYNVEARLNEILDEFDSEFKIPWCEK